MAVIRLDDVKDAGDITDSRLDGRIQALIMAVQSAAERHCHRLFDLDTYTEYHDACDQPTYIMVDNPPWVSITTLTDEEPISPITMDVTNGVRSEQRFKDEGRVQLYNTESAFSGGQAGVKIVYVGGWDKQSLPEELKQALVDEVLFRLNHGERIGLAAGASDGASADYARRAGFAADVADVLDNYVLLWKCI